MDHIVERQMFGKVDSAGDGFVTVVVPKDYGERTGYPTEGHQVLITWLDREPL